MKKKLVQILRPTHHRLKGFSWYQKAYLRAKPLILDSKTAKAENNQATDFVTSYEKEDINPNVVVYESFHGSSMSCSPKAAFLKLLDSEEHKDLHHIWVIDKQADRPKNYLDMPNVSFVARQDQEYPKILATAGMLINNSTFPTWYVRRKGQVYANTWHGVPLKGMFKNENGKRAGYANSQRNFLQASHIFLQNDYTVKTILGAADILPIVSPKTYTIGAPRIDLTLKEKTETAGKLKVLYAPTWRGALGKVVNFSGEYQLLIDSINEEFGSKVELIFKVHNFERNIISKLEGDFSIAPNDQDTNSLLAQVDVLITDYSSLMIDAMAADIPTILYTPDYKQYTLDRPLTVELDSMPAAIANETGEVCKALQNPIKPSAYSKKFSSAKDRFFCFEDGNATQRMLDVLFSSDDSAKPICTEKKELLVVYGGGWRQNGISASLLNLFMNLDYKKYNVALLTDGGRLNDASWELMQKIPTEIMQIHRVGTEGFTAEEAIAKGNYYALNEVGHGPNLEFLIQTMQREWRRVLGDVRPSLALEFSGYRRLWSFVFACSNAKKKIIIQHNELRPEAERRFPELFGIFETYKFFDKVLCVSEETKSANLASLSEYYKNKNQLGVLNNTLDTKKIENSQSPIRIVDQDGVSHIQISALKSEDGGMDIKTVRSPDPKKVSFITMGRFSDEKNHEMLLRAFKQLKEDNKNVELYLLGTGPLWKQTLSLRSKLGLESDVVMPGFVSNALMVLKECDCFVLSSKYEGQPMVLLEALAMQKPIIATDIPGSRSVLSDGNGKLVSDHRPEAFAAEMLNFCKSPWKQKAFDVQKYNGAIVTELESYFVK